MTIALDEFKADRDWQCSFQEAFNGCYKSSDEYDDDDNPSEPHPIHDVVEVIAADEGENDERDWICVVKLKDGRYAKVFAGCDYTGWD